MSRVKFCTAKDIRRESCTVVEVFDSSFEAVRAAKEGEYVFEVSEGETVKAGDRAHIGGCTGTVWS